MKNKIIPRNQIAALAADLRKQGQRIVFTNGCFDLLHVGHVRYLKKARSLGDSLILGLNSDRSVREIKGPQRPLTAEAHRAEVLAALECVSYVVLFNEPDPFRLIEAIKPHILVKGADWPEEKIIGADLVRSYGGQIRRIQLVPFISTTKLIQRIVSRYQGLLSEKGE